MSGGSRPRSIPPAPAGSIEPLPSGSFCALPSVRTATARDAAAASALVKAGFVAGNAGTWSPRAAARFLAASSPQRIRERLRSASFAAVAVVDQRPVGFILLSSPRVVDMLFVDPAWFLRGVGRALWEVARQHVEDHFGETRTVELNSVLSATGFYRALGFAMISAPFEVNGSRAVRMACWLPARHLGAEPAPADGTRAVPNVESAHVLAAGPAAAPASRGIRAHDPRVKRPDPPPCPSASRPRAA